MFVSYLHFRLQVCTQNFKFVRLLLICWAVGSLEVMASVFGPESPGSIPMLPKTHRVHAEYVFVKSMVLKVLRSIVSSLPRELSLEKISLPFRDTSKLLKWRWKVLPSILKMQKSDSCHYIMGLTSQK